MADIHKLDINGLRTDELLSRYIDGDLKAGALADFEEKLANDPTLRLRLERFQKHDQLLKAASRANATSVSPLVVARLEQAQKAKRPSWPRAAAGLSLAASIAVVVTVGLFGLNTDLGGNAGFQMDSKLAAALTTQGSRAEGWEAIDDTRDFRAVLTFPAANGNWCREFMVASGEEHWRGVACRNQDSWVTQVMAREVFLDQSAGYRTASAGDIDQVSRFIDAEATDVALSRSQETAVIRDGWHSVTRTAPIHSPFGCIRLLTYAGARAPACLHCC